MIVSAIYAMNIGKIMQMIDKIKNYEFTYDYYEDGFDGSKREMFVDSVLAEDYADAAEILERRLNKTIDHELIRIIDVRIVKD